MLLPDSWNSLMPKGKDFLAEFVAMMVVDADAEVEESLEALPAGLLRSRRKNRRIALGRALRIGDA
jgi:hypothetical protein